MTQPVAVIDTNVVVSGLLTGEPASPTAAILEGMLRGRFPYLLSLDLLAEYREVLLRPRIRRRHGLGEADVDVLLTELALNGSIRDPPPMTGAVPDLGDRHLWALLQSDMAAVLVTGDDALLKHPLEQGRVVSPRRFVPSSATAGEGGSDPPAVSELSEILVHSAEAPPSSTLVTRGVTSPSRRRGVALSRARARGGRGRSSMHLPRSPSDNRADPVTSRDRPSA